MHGYGWGWGWMMMAMMLFWIALIAVIIWAVVRFVRPGEGQRGRQGRETPQEILDRRLAQGEIDAEAYKQAQARLAGREPGSS